MGSAGSTAAEHGEKKDEEVSPKSPALKVELKNPVFLLIGVIY